MQTLRYPIVMFVITALCDRYRRGHCGRYHQPKCLRTILGQVHSIVPWARDVARPGSVTSASSNDPARYTSSLYYANQPFNGWVAYADYPIGFGWHRHFPL